MAGIYIHIPFCKTRCIYCDFVTQTSMLPKMDYIKALCKEMELRKTYLQGETIDTIYFGGGTPSQLGQTDFELIFESIDKWFEVSPNAEITLEANPDDLNETYLLMLRALPFNRISIGIQSFDDKELKFLNRRHSAQTAIDVVKNCKNHGFKNISIDLMYGLPNQTMEVWKQNLLRAIDLDVQHISSYHLIYEEGTKLYQFLQEGKVKTADEELSVEMFNTLIDKLSEAGFVHYEISNFAKPDLYSKHNSSYWSGAKYLGLGVSAHSFDGNNRGFNSSVIASYIDLIAKGLSTIEVEKTDKYTQYNDFIITGMRTIWGVDLSRLEHYFGSQLLKYCLDNAQKYISSGQLKHENKCLKLSRQGIFISDGIMSDLMWV